MKAVDVKSNTYIESSNEFNDKNPKFKIGNTVRISKCKNIFAKGYTRNSSKDQTIWRSFLWLKKLKILSRGHTLLVILKVKKLLERFTKTNCTKKFKKNLELKK